MEPITAIISCGILATLLMDAWALVRRALFGTPLPNYRLVGRWIAHMPRGRFVHESVGKAPAVRGESLVGWATHYLVGVAFAFTLAAVAGTAWFERPTPWPALLAGIASVAAPFLVMQPAMGAGIAASRTPRPGAARLQSLTTHFIFGLGLYAGGLLVHSFKGA